MSGAFCHIVFFTCGAWKKGRRSMLHEGASAANPANAFVNGCRL
jgi:hypothetical protein